MRSSHHGFLTALLLAACSRNPAAAVVDGAAADAPPAADGSPGADAPADAGAAYLPWAGGPAYYKRWSHGLSTDPSYFPVAVWLQSPRNAQRYHEVGINLFIGLDNGPTEDQLTTLAAVPVPVVCDQAGVWNAHLQDPNLQGWLQPDEPDNAQPKAGGGYDPCIPPATIVAGYQKMQAGDPSRPVLLGLGRGVADTQWVGRGTCTGHTEMYAAYAKGADILAFDIYPVNEGVPLEMVAAGVDNLRQWSGYAKPVLADIEASNFNATQRPSPDQIRTEVWMALVHGAAGVQYFCHRFKPTFSETDCLDDAPTAAALTRINAQIASLAPVLNSPSLAGAVTVTASVPVDVAVKRAGGSRYLFAVAMRGTGTTATFTLSGLPPTASATVIGEARTVPVSAGTLRDAFAGYGVHLYQIPD